MKQVDGGDRYVDDGDEYHLVPIGMQEEHMPSSSLLEKSHFLSTRSFKRHIGSNG